MTKEKAKLQERLSAAIVCYNDYPKPGVLFRDIMPIMRDVELLSVLIPTMAREIILAYPEVQALAVPEARGFLLGSMLAYSMRLPIIAVRKKGKLPGSVIGKSYTLEYGSATLEVGANSLEGLPENPHVVIFDDVSATGETINAAYSLVEALGGLCDGSYSMIDIGLRALPRHVSFLTY